MTSLPRSALLPPPFGALRRFVGGGVWALGLGLLALGFSGCGAELNQDPTPDSGPGVHAGAAPGTASDSGTQTAPVRVIAPERSAYRPVTEAPGVLVPRDPVPLSFSIGGVVTQLDPSAGDRFSANAVLGKIDTRELEAALEQARASRDQSERTLSRLERLLVDRVVPLAQVEEARTLQTVREADVRALEARLRDTELRAPTPGVVLRRMAQPGERVQAGQPILVVGTDRSGQVFRIGVPERDRLRIAIGDSAQVQLDSDRGAPPHLARVVRLGESPEPGLGTWLVELEMAGEGRPSGVAGRARIFSRNETTVVRVPPEALLEMGQGVGWLFVVSVRDPAPRARLVPVTLWGLENDHLLVEAEFADGEQIVVEGGRWIRDGQSVRIVK